MPTSRSIFRDLKLSCACSSRRPHLSTAIQEKNKDCSIHWSSLCKTPFIKFAQLILDALLRPLLASDAYALAIAAAISALRTVALWIRRRRVDWIGAYAVLGFSLALAITVLLAGNAFLLEVHGSLLTGAIGLVLLASEVVRKPLLEPVSRAFARKGPQGSSILESASIDPAGRQRIAGRLPIITTVPGLAFFGNAVVHVILALTLPTATLLVLFRLATIAILGGGVALLAWLCRRNASLVGS
jgi:hypothetical protein